MGHNIGVSKSYYKPTNMELLMDYLKAVDTLTMNKVSIHLEKEVIELKEKQDEISLMKLKHEKEMEAMDQKLNKIMSIVQQNPKLAHAKPKALPSV
jgi:hypothetical protein